MKPEGAERLHVEPIPKVVADEFISVIHRHHGPTPPGLNLFTIACVDDAGGVRGVATGAIPNAANRLSDGMRTLEVVRVATDGTMNTCSVLYGACARAAKALGYTRIITYTLTTEPGASLRGAGWNEDQGEFGSTGALAWVDRPGRRGTSAQSGTPKRRWSLTFWPERPDQKLPESIKASRDQLELFG